MSHINKLGFLEVEANEEEMHHGRLSQFIGENKTFCLSLFLFLCFLISTLVSIAVSLTVVPSPAPSTKAVMQLSNSLNEIKEDQAQLIKSYQVLKNEYSELEQHLRHNSASVLKNILMDQETNFQYFLQTLKAGMRDLSIEMPNGANWYENYGHQILNAQKNSIERHALLGLLETDSLNKENERQQ